MILLLTFLVGEVRLATEPGKGLLIVGGWCDAISTELWGPDGTQCMLQDLSSRSHTLSVLQDRVLACYDKSCDELTDNGWIHAQDLLYKRYFYTSIVTTDGMLLIGGASVNGGNETEELVPINGGPNQPAFSLEWWKYTDGSVCSIKINDTSLVLTRGDRSHSESIVTQLSRSERGRTLHSKTFQNLTLADQHMLVEAIGSTIFKYSLWRVVLTITELQ